VFTTLFDNSIRALVDSGKKRICISAEITSTYLILEFRDTGAGIPKHLVDRLFREKVESTDPRGSGNGCFNAGQIIIRRGANMRAERVPKGAGAAIHIELLIA
jgi:sensor histidine kinase regulating citrate/malate metabolism